VSHFKQIDESLRTDSLRPIAVVTLEPSDFAEQYALKFLRDARGDTVAALLQTDAGRQYMLVRHVDAPAGGTEVLAAEVSPEPKRDLERLLSALDLDESVVW
jgi:hypothetical protein